jgi:electron transfer flavoprotein alpha subunit
MMETILFLAHTEADGALPKAAFEALAAAKMLARGIKGASLVAGLVGSGVQPAADEVAPSGVQRILGVRGAEFGQSRYATDAAAAEALCRAAGASLIVAPGTSRWARTLPGVAHRIAGRIDTHATGVSIADGAPVVNRWYYRQRMEAAITRSQRPWIILVDPGCIQAWTGAEGIGTVELVEVAVPDSARRTAVTGIEAPAAGEQTIRPDAELLFVAGAGWTKKQSDGRTHVPDAERLILDFLHHSQASLGGSKSLVDLSGEGQAILRFMTHLNQVGQTGSTPRHPRGLATCCFGEEPHVVGWRFVNERRAINLDANCGWARGKADVLYVADAFEVMDRVNALLSSALPTP